MKFRNVLPAGLESDEEYDEFGDLVEKRTYPIKPQVENFQTVLRTACMTNNVPEIIRALNSGNMDINSYLFNGWTALMCAAFYGSLDAITYLLNNGADPLLQYDCHNVIMCVCNCNSSNETNLLNCLKLLANFDKIDINSLDRSGFSALMYACSNGCLGLVEFLVDHGADIEIQSYQNGETALFFAVRHNHVHIVKFLLQCGANKDATDNKNQTVYRIAELKNMVDILDLLTTDYNSAQTEVYSTENLYWDKVMNELENGFNDDVQMFLKDLSMEVYSNKLSSKKIPFKRLLAANNDQFLDMGIVLTPHRILLSEAVKCFHMRNWSSYCFINKNDEMNSENIAKTLGMVVRQLHIIDASLMYLGDNSYSLNPQKGQEAMGLLKNIKSIERKIFSILDKKVRMREVDYIGPRVVRNPKKKVSMKDKVLVATVVILALLRII